MKHSSLNLIKREKNNEEQKKICRRERDRTAGKSQPTGLNPWHPIW